jgi:hypothetical protein
MDKKHCDKCDSTKDVERYYFAYDRSMDPSGNGYNDDNEITDLCTKCALSVYQQICNKLARELGIATSVENYCPEKAVKFVMGTIGAEIVRKYNHDD